MHVIKTRDLLLTSFLFKSNEKTNDQFRRCLMCRNRAVVENKRVLLVQLS